MFALADIRVAYGERTVLAVEHLEIRSGEFVVILGRNGSGKTTLFRLLSRELKPSAGAVMIDGVPLGTWGQRALARRIAHLPQRLPEVPGMTVRNLAELGRFPWRGSFGRWQVDDRTAVQAALAETGTARFAERLVDELSGGERQRAWIAMLLAQDAPTLLLDEPISALDPSHQIEVLRLLARLNAQGRGIMTILHDVNLATRFATRIIVLDEGSVAFDGPPVELLDTELLQRVYELDIELVERPGKLPLVAPR